MEEFIPVNVDLIELFVRVAQAVGEPVQVKSYMIRDDDNNPINDFSIEIDDRDTSAFGLCLTRLNSEIELEITTPAWLALAKTCGTENFGYKRIVHADPEELSGEDEKILKQITFYAIKLTLADELMRSGLVVLEDLGRQFLKEMQNPRTEQPSRPSDEARRILSELQPQNDA